MNVIKKFNEVILNEIAFSADLGGRRKNKKKILENR